MLKVIEHATGSSPAGTSSALAAVSIAGFAIGFLLALLAFVLFLVRVCNEIKASSPCANIAIGTAGLSFSAAFAGSASDILDCPSLARFMVFLCFAGIAFGFASVFGGLQVRSFVDSWGVTPHPGYSLFLSIGA